MFNKSGHSITFFFSLNLHKERRGTSARSYQTSTQIKDEQMNFQLSYKEKIFFPTAVNTQGMNIFQCIRKINQVKLQYFILHACFLDSSYDKKVIKYGSKSKLLTSHVIQIADVFMICKT